MNTDTVAKPERLTSLDAYRGFIMLLMASAGLGASHIAKQNPGSAFWQFLGHQCDHVEWIGCAFWDLIQPAFMFMVGVTLPWSIANRRAHGQTFGKMFAHAVWRGVLLVLLAIFLQSKSAHETDWTFPNVLAQIGLGIGERLARFPFGDEIDVVESGVGGNGDNHSCHSSAQCSISASRSARCCASKSVIPNACCAIIRM